MATIDTMTESEVWAADFLKDVTPERFGEILEYLRGERPEVYRAIKLFVRQREARRERQEEAQKILQILKREFGVSNGHN